MGKNRIVGLDLGTTKIGVVVAEVNKDSLPNIVGVGVSPSFGMRRGTVVNLEKTVQSIRRAVEEAERMTGTKIDSAYVGIAGGHISGMSSKAMVSVEKQGGEITQRDVKRVLEQAQSIGLPLDREIIHVLPIEFKVDGESGIKDPVGMFGRRLEVEVHIVTGAVTSAQNIYKAVQRAKIKVKDLVLQPLASSYAVLEPDEKDLGVLLIDIGGGTTDLAIFKEGTIRYTQVIGLAGENITNDLALGLRTPVKEAEELKKKYGCALIELADDEEILVKGVGKRAERKTTKKMAASIIQPRIEEILSFVKHEVKKVWDPQLLAAGVVITGGTAHLRGIEQLAEEIFDLPVKVGKPWGISGLTDIVEDPIFSTAVGLIKYGVEKQNLPLIKSKEKEENLFDSISERMKKWIKEFF